MVADGANRDAKGKLNREDHGWRRLPVEGLWPPKEWPQFAGVTTTNKTSLQDCPRGPGLAGASFCVEAFDRGDGSGRPLFRIRIEEWLYTVSRGPVHRPLLEIAFTVKKPFMRAAMADLVAARALSRPLETDAPTAARCMAAALAMMKEIDAGRVPAADAILRDYALYPFADAPAN